MVRAKFDERRRLRARSASIKPRTYSPIPVAVPTRQLRVERDPHRRSRSSARTISARGSSARARAKYGAAVCRSPRLPSQARRGRRSRRRCDGSMSAACCEELLVRDAVAQQIGLIRSLDRVPFRERRERHGGARNRAAARASHALLQGAAGDLPPSLPIREPPHLPIGFGDRIGMRPAARQTILQQPFERVARRWIARSQLLHGTCTASASGAAKKYSRASTGLAARNATRAKQLVANRRRRQPQGVLLGGVRVARASAACAKLASTYGAGAIRSSAR